MSDIPSSGKMVNLLILIKILKLGWSDQPSPESIPRSAFTESEPSSLKGIHDTVISMRGVIDPESQG